MPFSVPSLALFPDRRMYSDPIDTRWGKRGTRRRESWQKQKQGAPHLEAWAVAGLPTGKPAEIEECHLHGLCAWDGREGGDPRKSHLSGFSFSSLGTSVSQFRPSWAFRSWLRCPQVSEMLTPSPASLVGTCGNGQLWGAPRDWAPGTKSAWPSLGVSRVVGSPGLSAS